MPPTHPIAIPSLDADYDGDTVVVVELMKSPSPQKEKKKKNIATTTAHLSLVELLQQIRTAQIRFSPTSTRQELELLLQEHQSQDSLLNGAVSTETAASASPSSPVSSSSSHCQRL
jgi:hypothetical protein